MSDLKNFSSTASCKSMAESARKLNITLPSLSESIKRLEKDLGTTLFYRTRSGVSLTPSGKELLNKSKNVFSAIEEIDELTSSELVAQRKTISIGCHPQIATYTLPQSLRVFYQSLPGIQTNLIHGLSREVQASVQKGSLDIGIVVNPSPATDIIVKKIGSDEMAVWTRDLKTSYDRIICDADLFQVQSILRKWKKRPTNLITTSSLELAARLSVEGIGYSILPSRLVEIYNLPLKKLTHIATYSDAICLVYRPEFGKIDSERILIKALEESLKHSKV